MSPFARLLLAAIWLLPGAAWAETHWHKPGDLVANADSISRGTTRTYIWTANTDDSVYLYVGDCFLITAMIHPSTATADLYGCDAKTGVRANDCLTLDIDTNGDNVPDTSSMDGSDKAKRRWTYSQIPGWLVVHPTSSAGQLNVACGGTAP